MSSAQVASGLEIACCQYAFIEHCHKVTNNIDTKYEPILGAHGQVGAVFVSWDEGDMRHSRKEGMHGGNTPNLGRGGIDCKCEYEDDCEENSGVHAVGE